MERAHGHEPDAAVDAAHGMAGERPGESEERAAAHEQRPQRGRARMATEHVRDRGARERHRDADEADHAHRRVQHGAQRPARVVSHGAGEDDEHAHLRGGGEEGAPGDEGEDAIEGAGRIRRARRSHHRHCEDGTADRDGLAHEPDGAQP